MGIYLGSDKISNVNILESANLTTLAVTPSKTAQTHTPTGSVDGWNQVNVSAVTSSIDSNITAGNIKDGVSILGVTGNYTGITPNLTTLGVTPSTSSQTITPTGSVDGWNQVNVSAVTSSIDSNITAGNIKNGVTILGVTGTLSPGSEKTYGPLCFAALETSSSISLTSPTSLNVSLQYSYDNVYWRTWTYTTSGSNKVFDTINLATIGDKVYISGNNATLGTSSSAYSQFSMTGRIAASGSIQYLLTTNDSSRSVPAYCFYNLFVSCNVLVTPPDLPATTLNNYCYYRMFSNCTSLVTAPDLPATTMKQACYQAMFQACSVLVKAPDLPATTLATQCYYQMFAGCTQLKKAPDLPATTLSTGCYYSMFNGCTGLLVAPAELPATTLAANCYNMMFQRCTQLRMAPELPATSVTVAGCYNSMFNQCSNLQYIKVKATSWNTSCTTNWVASVYSSGVFVKPSTTTIATGTNGIPSGWTVNPL